MFPPGKVTISAVVLFLGGCATAPRLHQAQVPDWESEDSVLAREAAQTSPLPEVARGSIASPPPALNETEGSFETWIPIVGWCKDNDLPAPSRLSAAPLSGYALSGAEGVLIFDTGSKLAHWGGLELWLGFAPQLIGGEPFVHWLDLRKTIQPLVASRALAPVKASPVVVIDAGHGGVDSGARSVVGNAYEKDFTLDWAQRLERVLSAAGWQALLTRSNDVDMGLSNRVTYAVAHQADLFLSLHFNSAGTSQTQAGLETYCLTPTGLPSSVTRGYADDTALSFANNAFDTENLQLALRVHQALLEVNGHRDRGVRRARFPTVLRGQQCPAILVEGGYLSNPDEARQIADAAYRQKLAEAVAAALLGKTEVRSAGEIQSLKPEVRGPPGGASSTSSPPNAQP